MIGYSYDHRETERRQQTCQVKHPLRHREQEKVAEASKGRPQTLMLYRTPQLSHRYLLILTRCLAVVPGTYIILGKSQEWDKLSHSSNHVMKNQENGDNAKNTVALVSQWVRQSSYSTDSALTEGSTKCHSRSTLLLIHPVVCHTWPYCTLFNSLSSHLATSHAT